MKRGTSSRQPRRLRDGSLQDGQALGSDQYFDASCAAGLTSNQPRAFEAKNHLVNRGRADPEVSLQISLRGRTTEHASVGPDEGQILSLLFGEGAFGMRLGRVTDLIHSPEEFLPTR